MTDNTDITESTATGSPAMRMAAKTVSFIFSPLIVPTYCTWMIMWGTTLSWLPARLRWITVLYTLLFTCVVPLGIIAAMRLCGRASDMSLRNRRERILPYMAAILCYGAACYHFYAAHAPAWFYTFFIGAGIAILLSLLISLRWKISAHAAVMGGWIAMVLRIMTGPYVTVDMASFTFPCIVIFTGAVCTSRLAIGAHTPLQLLAGVINGFICVWLTTAIAPLY